MWINSNGTEIEVYNFKKIYLDGSDISKLIEEYKEEIFFQLANNHKEEMVEELLKYGIVLNNRNLDEIYLKHFGKLMDEISYIKQYYKERGKELEENLERVMDDFFEKREVSELKELESKIDEIQSEIRYFKLNETIAGIASIASIMLFYLFRQKETQ